MPALSRRVRGRGGEAELAVNVIVHGPAARSLTTAATGGTLKEQNLGARSLVLPLFKAVRGSEPEAKTSPCEVVFGVEPLQRLAIGTCRSRSQMKPTSSRASATLTLGFMTPRRSRCQPRLWRRTCAFHAIARYAVG